MLVQDLDFNKTNKINKLNSFLKENYGFTVDVSAPKEQLVKLREELSQTVLLLKVEKNMTPKDSEFTKNLLILECVDLLLSNSALTESHNASRRYENVITWLSDYVVKNVELGDDLDEAIGHAMKEYRSSKWRFADYEVEYDVRERVKDELVNLESMYEAEAEELEEYHVDKVGRYVSDPETADRAEKFLAKKAGGSDPDVEWDHVTTSLGAKPTIQRKPKPGRGHKAVFDLPETKGTK